MIPHIVTLLVANKENVFLLQSLLSPGEQKLMSLVVLDISFNKLSVVWFNTKTRFTS